MFTFRLRCGTPHLHCEILTANTVCLRPQIVGDAVGWGFVVRGSKPCHIQAVDPSGPAAAAGMKVCMPHGTLGVESADLNHSAGGGEGRGGTEVGAKGKEPEQNELWF